MNLCIDQGNTRIKYALFENDLMHNHSIAITDISEVSISFKNLLKEYPIDKVIVCNVSGNPDFPYSLLFSSYKIVHLDHQTPIPLINNYLTPHTLGNDRMAAAIGGFSQFPNHDILVIDMGTAITFDIVSKEGEFDGGNISPGMSLRFKALNAYTGRLPLCEYQREHDFFGRSTQEAIVAGVLNSIKMEIEGYIDYFNKIYQNPVVILTGGDANKFEIQRKSNIFAIPDLVLYGLNNILEFNSKE